MEIALLLVVIGASVVATAAAARRLDLPAPLLLIGVGFVGSYLPFVPEVELTPDLVLLGLLPPLLYAAAIRTSLVDFRQNAWAIASLSVGLVVFTTVVVGLLVWWMLPVPLAAAFALGAVVAPPDAVAATSVARRVGMPRRTVTILEGESLVNDATALVTLRTAIAASTGAGLESLGGGTLDVAGDFALSAVGGLGIGVVVAVLIVALRKRLTDTMSDVSLSMLAPWLAYIPAEEIHASGVLAVVVTGLVLGHKSPIVQTASSRVLERTIWATIGFVLENAVFLLIGLQVFYILEDLQDSEQSVLTMVGVSAVVLVAVVVLRFVWVFPVTWGRWRLSRRTGDDPPPSWQSLTIVSWAGMRGVVTLAAVFLLPEDTPYRETFVAVAFVVTVGTLLLLGSTLPWLVRTLGVRGPSARDDHLQEATVLQRASNAGLAALDDILTGSEADDVVERLRTRSFNRANAVWERLGGPDEAPAQQYARLRGKMLVAEREEVLKIRRKGTVDQSVLQRVLATLDVEETILERARTDEAAEELDGSAGTLVECEHLLEHTDTPEARTPGQCEGCLAEGTVPVHLRICMTCGYVGCCDSSVGLHATRHFEDTGHPVMQSHEPGERWRWCYEHHLTG